MNGEKDDQDGISDYLKQIYEQLDSQDVVELRFDNFIEFLPSYNGEDEINKESIVYLSAQFQSHSLDSEPRIRQGFIKHELESPIFIYKSVGSFDPHSNGYRNGLLMVRVAAIMACIDSVIDEEEIIIIRNLIWDMNYLSMTEKNALYAKVKYLLAIDKEFDERARDYISIFLDRDRLIEKIPELSQPVSKALLQVAQDIALADGFLERGELRLLQDIYRALGLSAHSTRTDLEKYAAEQYIDIKTRKSSSIMAEEELDEIYDVLGDMLMDFDDF